MAEIHGSRRSRPSGAPPARLAAAVAGMLLWAGAAAAAAGPPSAACDPAVAEVLAATGRAGVAEDTALIRDPRRGIRNPDSIFDFSCVEDMFAYRSFDMFFDPGRAVRDILGLARRRICAAAREAYGRYLGRGPDPRLYGAGAPPRLPGIPPGPGDGGLSRDGGLSGGGSVRSLRHVIGAGQ